METDFVLLLDWQHSHMFVRRNHTIQKKGDQFEHRDHNLTRAPISLVAVLGVKILYMVRDGNTLTRLWDVRA
jgi:hypothetical protein